MFDGGGPIGKLAAEDVEGDKRHGHVFRGCESIEWRLWSRSAGEVLAVVVSGVLLLENGDCVQVRFHRGGERLLLAAGIPRYRDGGESADHGCDDQDFN